MVRRATALAGLLVLASLGTATAAVPRPGGSYPGDRWLAHRFRPHLLFDSREPWRPLDVDRFLREPGHLACPQATVPPPCVPLTDAAHHFDR